MNGLVPHQVRLLYLRYNYLAFLHIGGILREDRKSDKPFLTWEEQVNLLKKRGLKFIRESSAVDILKHNSYYELINNYKSIFMKYDKNSTDDGVIKQKEEFIENVSLEYINSFSILDKSIQSILIKYSLNIEIYFKNIVAYVISNRIGELESEYLNIDTYHKFSKNNYSLKKLEEQIDKLKDIKNKYKFNPTAYYRSNHDNVPPWILFKNVTFNNMISYYKSLLPELKLEIMNEMIPGSFDWTLESNKQFFIDSLNIIKNNRNKISHHNFFLKRTEQSKEQFRINLENIFNIEDYKYFFIHDIDEDVDVTEYNKGLYPYIVLIMVFLNDEEKKFNFNFELRSFVDKYKDKNNANLLFHYIELTNLPKSFGKINMYVL